MKFKKRPATALTCLSKVQVKRFLEQAKEMDTEWYPIWVAACYTGMRNGELYALTWDKVDFKAKRIKVDCSWNKKDGFKSTKSGDERWVEIAEPLATVLKEERLRQGGDSNFVLPRLREWDKGQQARALRYFLQGMGLPVIRFHDLRATWDTLLLCQGIAPLKVMSMGDWRDMKIMIVYIRKAGIDIDGITKELELHDPSLGVTVVLKIGNDDE